ncbi:hypothetical protein Fmac_012839 [Flemingia macrophylla]|uniref:Phytocyanin domain-containing protein n=1 Tax=Flemingia macrophylla TaxID=520843 RepID=A0ABD1MRH9_9FABA
MHKLINMAIVFVLVALQLPHSTEATEHPVDWIIYPEGASFYSSFASKTTFKPNDTLVFNFTTGTHNVVTVSKKNFEACNVSDVMEAFNTGPVTFTLNRTGMFYFTCAFPNHCSLGQKLSIDVTKASSSSSLAPSPSASRAAMPLAVTVTVTLPVLIVALAT